MQSRKGLEKANISQLRKITMKNRTAILMAVVFSVLACGRAENSSTVQAVTAAVKVSEVSLEGQFIRVQAIGSESTGFGLQTAAGDVVELDLRSNNLQDLFIENKAVKVNGIFHNVTGIEIPNRKVLVVSKIEEQVLSAEGTIIHEFLDGCGFMIQLADGSRLEAEIPQELEVSGLKVSIEYIIEPRPSICMAGQTVKLVSIKLHVM
jgi:hypothetical protein